MPLPSGTLLDNTARGITKLDYAVTRRIGHELFSLHARHIASHRIAGGTRELICRRLWHCSAIQRPNPREGGGLGPVWSPDEREPGTWCHISIPCTYTSLMAQPPVLESVTLLLDYVLCRIRHVHVYDGGNLIAYWNDGTESGPQRAGSPKPDPYWPEPKNNLKLLPDRFCSVEAS